MEIQERIFRGFIEELRLKDEIDEEMIEKLISLWENKNEFTEDELLTVICGGEANVN